MNHRVWFNTLTLSAVDDINRRMQLLGDFLKNIWKPFAAKTGEKHIFCEKKEDVLRPKDYKSYISPTVFQLALSSFHAPYIDDCIERAGQTDRFLGSVFTLSIDGAETPCPDMGAGILTETYTFGCASSPFWKRLHYTVTETDIEGNRFAHPTCCITQPKHIEDPDVIDWENRIWFATPIPTAIPAEQKKIALRDDHGKNLLQPYAKRLCHSEYVLEVVNSCPFSPTCHETVPSGQSFENGLVEFRLIDTDKKFGMIVRTTGTNTIQTHAIAAILRSKYFDR